MVNLHNLLRLHLLRRANEYVDSKIIYNQHQWPSPHSATIKHNSVRKKINGINSIRWWWCQWILIGMNGSGAWCAAVTSAQRSQGITTIQHYIRFIHMNSTSMAAFSPLRWAQPCSKNKNNKLAMVSRNQTIVVWSDQLFVSRPNPTIRLTSKGLEASITPAIWGTDKPEHGSRSTL